MTVQNYNSNNKRIAKNTLVVYGQLMLRLILGLYTSRLALEALGVSDFGLYSVVAGVVSLFTFISDSLSGTTVRFINVERGKADGDMNRIFNICHVLHISMAIFMFLILEFGGLFYIHYYLNVEAGRETDAIIAFQVATFVCCIGIINIPFFGLINSVEKFLFTAVVAISIKIAQLMLLIWLIHYEGNRVVAFALIESLTTFVSFAIYHLYCYSHWPEIVKWRISRCWKLYKEILMFSYYNLISSVAGMARS
jgi:O-antigen/teichoic acid export membrane protein